MNTTATQDRFAHLVSYLSIAAVAALVSLVYSLSLSHDLQFAGLAAMRAQTQQGPQFAALDPAIRHEAETRFNQGVGLLHAKQYEYAVTALSRVIELVPNMPEAYVNMGFALLGMERYEEAGNFFNRATILRPEQANAYWGLAEALEGMKDYEGALGAMRSYIHLSPPDDPYVAKARSALWELEAQLGRVPGVRVADEGSPEDMQQLQQQEQQRPRWQGGH